MTLDTALISGNLVFVTAFLAILIWRRVYIRLPVFVAYMGYTVLLALASLASLSNAADYLLVWDVGIAVDTLFYLCVLVELGRSVRRYNGASRVPQELLWLLFLGASVPIGLLTQWPGIVRLRLVYQLTFRVMQATAVLEIAALLTIALWSGFKKLRWPERELRLIMGMCSWALVQLFVLLLHEHGLMGPDYHWLDLLTPVCTLGVFIYWLHYFWLDPRAQAEAGMGSLADRVAEATGIDDSHRSSRIGLAGQEGLASLISGPAQGDTTNPPERYFGA